MAQTCVLDASAVIRLIGADPTAAVWAQDLAEAALVMAPELMLTEVANTLWKLQRARDRPRAAQAAQICSTSSTASGLATQRRCSVS